ncbi:AarF/UbiB family protein [Mycolicibacterium moriokaense]
MAAGRVPTRRNEPMAAASIGQVHRAHLAAH